MRASVGGGVANQIELESSEEKETLGVYMYREKVMQGHNEKPNLLPP